MVHNEKAKLTSLVLTLVAMLFVIGIFRDTLQNKNFQIAVSAAMIILFLGSYSIMSKAFYNLDS